MKKLLQVRDESRSAVIVARWERLIRCCLRIRSLQRIWSYLGHHLHRHISEHIRQRVQALYRLQ